jgi:hypothetical protein
MQQADPLSSNGAGQPMEVDRDPIFILASGQRCGSTLLQRLLNSHPQVMIWGEQEGHLERFLTEHRALGRWAKRHDDLRLQFLRDGYDGFMPNVLPDETDVRNAAARYLEALFGRPATRMGRPIWGFKEVRYDADVALMLLNLFPDARFIHLTRHVTDCYRSLKRWEAIPGRWRPEWTSMFLDDWVRINSSFLKEASQFPRLMRIRYEDAITDQEGLIMSLAAFVGVEASRIDRAVFAQQKAETWENEEGAWVDPSTIALDDEDKARLGSEEVVCVLRALGYEPKSFSASASRVPPERPEISPSPARGGKRRPSGRRRKKSR